MNVQVPSQLWQRRRELHTDIIESTNRHEPLPECNRGSWYCPTVSQKDADRLIDYCISYDINTIYDLGTGEGTFAAYMYMLGFDVVAFETLDKVIEKGERNLPLGDVDVRREDYYEAFDDIRENRAAFCAWGRTNKLPDIPEQGIVIEGPSFEEADMWINGVGVQS